SAQRVPGYRQEERLAVLSRPRETHGRSSRTGTDPMVRFGILALSAELSTQGRAVAIARSQRPRSIAPAGGFPYWWKMRPEEFRSRLRGVIAFPVTPFKPDFALDLEGLRKNIQELLRHRIAAIVAVGGTGEMYSLTPVELMAVVKTIVEEVRGQVPVISGTGFNRQMAIEIAQQSAQAGVDGILALPPYYPNADDEGLADYYAAIGAATPLGLFVYSRDWV